jgi:hypothetical protein
VEIAKILNLSGRHVHYIRSKILGITLYGRKKTCIKCDKLKDIVCFTTKVEGEYKKWCVKCRRKFGISEPYQLKNQISRNNNNRNNITVECLRCDSLFISELLNGSANDYYHLCPHCRKVVTNMERVSI